MTDQRADRPTVSVYQNGDAVAGILQQAFQQPLPTDYSSESTRDDTQTRSTDSEALGEGKGKVAVPAIGSVEAGIGADYRKRHESGTSTGASATSTWTYTQAYYLYAARDVLRENGLIRSLNGLGDAEALSPGDFVEFTCRFDPSQIAALLDIITPDLVRAIARYVQHKKSMRAFNGADHDGVLAFIARMDAEVAAAGEMAHAAAAAMEIDFRSAKTREFYGRIGADDDAVTAITMCDLMHFVTEDEDRLLDGEFSVFAKVTEPVRQDVPVLARNKVLSRLDPETVEHLLSAFNRGALVDMQKTAAERVINVSDEGDEPHDTSDPDGVGFDFTIDSRVNGPSVKVLPIAIYV